MKKMSIRTRITLWYTVVLMIFLYFGVVGSYNATRHLLLQQNEEGMRKGAQMLAEKLIASDAHNYANFFTENEKAIPKDLNFIFFNNENNIVYGQYESWMTKLPQQIDQIRMVEHNDQNWASFDSEIYKNGQKIGVTRALINVTPTFLLLEEMQQRGIIAIIPSLLLSALGGFFITRWALKPIKNIAKIAKEIGNGNLNKRIQQNTAKDELGELLNEFNHMADNLQNVIEREQQFSSDASHEIRTPLAVIITNVEYAIQSQNLETCIQTLELVMNKSQQMQLMLSQLLTLARGHDQSQAMELEPLDIGSIITDIVEERSIRAQEKQITVEVEAEQNVIVSIDLMLFTRMITNLLDNAVQYGHIGGHVTISAHRNLIKNQAVILVIDDGIGIASDQLPYIFNRFYRIDKSRSQIGSGLGLSFVDFIVKLLNGNISIDSHPGKGSCFKITLPLIK